MVKYNSFCLLIEYGRLLEDGRQIEKIRYSQQKRQFSIASSPQQFHSGRCSEGGNSCQIDPNGESVLVGLIALLGNE